MEGCPSGLHELLLYEASSATTGDPNVAGRPAPDAIKRRFQQPIYPSYPPSSFFVAPEEPPLSQGAHGCWEQPSDCAYALHLVSGQQRSESGGLLRECSQEFKQCSLAPAPAQRRMSCHSLTRRHHLTGAVDSLQQQWANSRRRRRRAEQRRQYSSRAVLRRYEAISRGWRP